MMIESSSKGYRGNEEEEEEQDYNIKTEKVSKGGGSSSSSSRAWSAFRNPRIVRVSRALGGKDRHSKVCTIRGLRDRRIRLSVPTAIQLYDLQDRLGLNQPSKVVDWLLEATKSDIDKLPPLQFPHFFPQFHQQTLLPSPGTSHHLSGLFYDANNTNQSLMPKPRYLDIDKYHSGKGKELAESVSSVSRKGKENVDNQDDSAQNNKLVFPFGTINNSSSLPGMLNNGMAYNNSSYHHSEPSSLSLSQFGSQSGLLYPSHHHNSSSGSGVHFASPTLSLPCAASHSQLLFSPPPHAPSAFYSVENGDPRQSNNNNFQIFSSGSQVMMPHPLIQSLHPINSPLRRLPMPFSSKLLHDPDNNSSTPDKE